MMECSQNPIGFKQLVFAGAQDCENLLKMGGELKQIVFAKRKISNLNFF